MITAALALLSTRWVQYAIASVAFAALATWGVHTYNTKIITKAVLKEGERKEAIYKPKFEGLTKQFNDLKTQVITDRLNATSAANAAIAQEKLNASLKTAKYQAEISILNAEASKFRAAHTAAADDLAQRLRYATQPLAAGDSSGQQGVRLSDYTNGLSILYGKCEKDVGVLIETAAGALDRLGEAEAAVRALKP